MPPAEPGTDVTVSRPATATQSFNAPETNSARRLVSLDVFRGLIVAAMILVTDPGTYSAVYPQLLHAPWNGITATDTIFPSFLFIVGVSITLSFASRLRRGDSRSTLAWHVLRRSIVIFFLGLAVNGFPDYHWQTLRLPGILQRIAVCYLFGALLYLLVFPDTRQNEHSKARIQTTVLATITVGVLTLYYLLLKIVPAPGFEAGRLDSLGSLPAYIDRAAFGTKHLWPYGITPGVGVTYDPEGILSTLPAIATVLIGVLVGEWLRVERPARQKLAFLLAAGVVLLLAGWLLQPLLPINKRLWTSTFVLFSSGISLLVFALVYAVVDLQQSRWWTAPALVFGTNAILAFVLSSVITSSIDHIHVPGGGAAVSLHKWAYQHIFASWLMPIHASIAYAIMIVLVNLALIFPLYRKRMYVRI
jgi:predicted acyltransferase